jgi:drug/metabolite transporter (DMT)-like permease
MKTTSEPVLTAAMFIFSFAVLIGLTDNLVRLIAPEVGVWQFHFTRSVMAGAVLLIAARPLGLRLRPKNLRPVVVRSVVQALAVMIYFGALAFLPVATAAAGLFTAPIFVLLISRFALGHRFGPVRVAAVAMGFVGVAMVLGPEAMGGASLAALFPVLAGVFYAVSVIATRQWCAGESTETLTMGFFLGLAAWGIVGMVVLAVLPIPVPEGANGFVLRGWVWPSAYFLGWTLVQAVGALIAIAMSVRAYQMAEASRVSVFEYMALPAAAFWGWVLWDEQPLLLAVLGMGLIAASGILIALRSR